MRGMNSSNFAVNSARAQAGRFSYAYFHFTKEKE